MPMQKLREFLEDNEVKYVTIQHSEAFTALEVAQSAHIPGREMAKTIMVKIDGALAMVVLAAPERIDFDKLLECTGAHRVELATEHEFGHVFPGCEVGAMPPFGNLWGLPVYASETLLRDESLAFAAGRHTEILKLPFADFHRLVQPKIVAVASRSESRTP